MKKEDADDLVKKGNEFFDSENYEEAIKYFAEAARIQPENEEIYVYWGTALYYLSQIKHDESLFRESFEEYEKATQIKPDYADAFFNWGTALSALAQIKQDESLFRESLEKYAKAAQLKPDYADAFFNWGTTLYCLAQIKQDESLFRESFEKYEKVAQLKPDYAFTFINWGMALSALARIKQDESLFRETCEKYAKAAQLKPDYDDAFFYWGMALCDLAQIKQDESLFREACEKYDKATQLKPDYAAVFFSWGITLCFLAEIKQDESLFTEACEKYDKATQLKPDYYDAFYLWGYALSKIAIIMKDEDLVKKLFKVFYAKSDSLKKLNKDILEIFVLFGNSKIKKLIELELFYPLLDSDTDDGRFFKEATKDINKSELNKYKRAYILSISIISQLHVNNENEKFVASYRDKTITQKILFEDQTDPKDPKKSKDLKFRLNAINYSNDPTEGKILFDYLFDEDKRPADKTLNREYSAFAGCFIFNHDSLNHFRLYGKEDGREGTGLSLVFRGSFFSEKAKLAMKQPKTEDSDTDGKEEKHSLFRCIYIDPITQRVETVGHKEKYLFYREKKELEAKGEAVEDIEEKWAGYYKYITSIIENVREEMEELKKLAREKDLKPVIMGQLLINLRYLTKHIAFKEEQECRIVRIYRLDDERIKTSDDFKQMYVEYQPKVSDHVEKIYFGPKADGMELFQDMVTHKGLTRIHCYKSKNPLA
jgi:tetratricopeptide (TPR) repeat protein